MKLTHAGVLTLALVLVAGTVAAQQNPGQASLNLPPDHHYEAYDPATGQSITPLIPPGGQGYTPVNPGQIPGFVAQGLWIYDRTAGRWVHHPSVGGVAAEYRGAPAAGTPTAPAGAGVWTRLHGTVQSVSGSTLQFKADDGRTVSVDVSRVSPAVQQALKPQEGATVIGVPREGDRFEAHYVQQDSSDPSRGGVVVGQPATGPVDEQAWQRVRGVVQSVEGNTLRFRAEDGRTVTADVAQVNDAVRGALGPGDEITVVGFYRGNRNTMTARYIQEDGAPAAAPRTQ